MRIAFIDFEHHGKVAAKPSTLQTDVPFVLGKAEPGKTLGDLTQEDHLITVASNRMIWLNPAKFRCKVSLLIAEPPEVQGRYHLYLKLFGHKFHRILTQYSSLLKDCPNARFLAFGTTWVKDKARDFSGKNRGTSLIASAKRSTSGHRLRHRVIKAIRAAALDVDIMGRGYKPFDTKESALGDYRFSVVIENTREAGYFSEKLIDCLICETLPIYWGAPDIEHFFDPRGMIICRTEAELMVAIRQANEGLYQSRRPFMLENKRRALAFDDYYLRAGKVLADEMPVTS